MVLGLRLTFVGRSLGLEWPDTDPLTMAELFESRYFLGGEWKPDIEPWLHPRCGADTLLRGLRAGPASGVV